MIVDYRIVDYGKRRTEHTPILIDGAVVEQVGHDKTYSPSGD